MGDQWKNRWERLRACCRSLSATAWVRVGLGLLAGTLLAWLLFSRKPWQVTAPEGGQLKVDDFVVIYFWVAAAINLGLTALLAATAGIWMRPRVGGDSLPVRSTPRWFWPLVLLAMGLVAVCALPRLNDSFWDDEEYNVRHSIWGRFKAGDEPDTYWFKKLGWEETFFDYREPNNHILHSLLARASLTAWQTVSPPRGGLPFSEWPLRVPAWLFGILGVATVAWFLKDAGFAGAGVVAAWLTALHPWVLRYASEMRGYSMVVALMPVAWVCWRRAYCGGAWRWWMAYAGVQWAVLYTYPGVLFALCFLNLFGLGLLAFSRTAAGPFGIQFGRWAVANTLAAIGVIQWMLPLLPQVRDYFAFLTNQGFVVGWPWMQATLAYLFAGTPWVGATAAHPALLTQWGGHPGVLAVAVGLAVGLVGVGAVRWMVRSGWPGTVVVVSIFVPPFFTVGLSMWNKQMIYSSYVISALPGLVACAALGVGAGAAALRRIPGGRGAAAVWVGAVLAGFAGLTQPTRAWLMSHPLQPIKDSVVASRGSLDPKEHPEILTASFCIPPYLYDPLMVRLDSVRDFREMMRRADEEHRPLVINIGMPWAAREYSPQMWALMQEEALFTNHRTLRGFDAGLDRILATYRPGSSADYDFSGYEESGR